jgi:chromosome segregation ATPase
LSGQEAPFGSIYAGLDSLETLMNAMHERNETLQSDINNLETNLAQSGELLHERNASIARLQALLTDLKTQSDAMREAYKRQRQSLQKSEQRLRNWRLFALVALPITAVISGGLTLLLAE